ncbi:MAG: hypothetical protein NT120_00670 [Candidatus Aenigmarchaeota archaeon]|nr:hypothetical protein [Candidatus Aenigmarchaeota archaeon]
MEAKQKSRLLEEAVFIADEFIKIYETFRNRPLFSIPNELVEAERNFLKQLSKEEDVEKLQQILDTACMSHRWAKMNVCDELASLIYMYICWPLATRINTIKK